VPRFLTDNITKVILVIEIFFVNLYTKL